MPWLQNTLMTALREDRKVAELLKMPLLTDPNHGNLGPSETFEETFRKIDVASTDTLSWPEFASYFGKSYLGFAGLPTTQKIKTQGKAYLVRTGNMNGTVELLKLLKGFLGGKK